MILIDLRFSAPKTSILYVNFIEVSAVSFFVILTVGGTKKPDEGIVLGDKRNESGVARLL